MTWPTKSLGDVVTFKGGGTPSRDNPAYWNGPIPWATVKDLNSGYVLRSAKESITAEGLKRSASNLIPPGSVVIPTRMALGKAVITEVDIAINQDLKAVLPNAEIDPRFLMWFFVANGSKIEAMGKGATVKGVTLDQLGKLPFPLPPLPEQRRIAAILDKADTLRAKRREAIDKLEQLLQSVFVDMFGDPVTNPKEWPMYKFGDVTKSRLGKMLDKRTSQGPYMKAYLANANVQWGRFDLNSLRKMNFDPEDQLEFSLKSGDLLICEGGEPGRCAIWKEERTDCYYQKALHRVRCDPGYCVPEYLQRLFWFLSMSSAFDSSITTATIAHLPGIKLKALRVPMPPVSLQKSFAEILDSVGKIAERSTSSHRAVESLFLSLQKQAFEGGIPS